jgi:AcrR family transcriptional regulator
LRQNRRAELILAAIHQVAGKGVKGTTVRQIAESAGMSEGAVYRHFASKDDLCQQAYLQIVAEMAADKQQIAASQLPLRDKFRKWVQVSYAYFDRFPEAFTYILLTAHELPEDQEGISTRQGRLLLPMLDQVPQNPLQPMAAELMLCLFTGVLLNVPRQINTGVLQAPASQYTERVAQAVWRIFGLA